MWLKGVSFIKWQRLVNVSLLERVIADLVQAQDGRFLTRNNIELFLVSVELAYRELAVLELTNQLSTEQKEAVNIVRQCLHLIRQLQLLTEVSQLHTPSVVVAVAAGAVGRPRHKIPEDSLEMLLENRFTVPQIASMLGVSVSTVRRRMSAIGVYVTDYYSTTTDDELDEIVRNIQQEYPMCGNRQMQGHLICKGYRIQQVRLKDSQRRIDPCGSALRRLHVLNCRQYSVPSPLSLYHIDGHHKLIR